MEQKRPARTPLFVYPPLPRLEIWFYFTVVIVCIINAWIRVFQTSRLYPTQSDWYRFEKVQIPGFGSLYRDITNAEWNMWTVYALRQLPWQIGHSLLFNISERFLSERSWRAVMMLYWLTAHFCIAGPVLITATIIQGVTIYATMYFLRQKLLGWLLGVTILWFSAENHSLTGDDPIGFYLVMSTFPYKMVQYLSFVTEMLDQMSDEDRRKPRTAGAFFLGLYRMFWYAFYLPYSSALIVIYRRFPGQLADRHRQPIQWRRNILFGVRILFWTLLAELSLYFLYEGALMSNPSMLHRVSEDTLVGIGYAVGQFFHLKYVAVFGLGTFFARFDRMQPFDGPICISRVVLYSKIWRCFDRGLYEFFKEYIFVPICRPTFSIPRKLLGLLFSYAFVLLWHGGEHQYVVWIVLNLVELLMENVSKGIYSIPAVRALRERYISDRNFRRILAWLQVCPFAFGLYSNFYFLGDSSSGYVFVERIFWQETVPVNWPFILLISCGYCFSHVCMEVEMRQAEKKLKSQ